LATLVLSGMRTGESQVGVAERRLGFGERVTVET
jgi:hypothetical protein